MQTDLLSVLNRSGCGDSFVLSDLQQHYTLARITRICDALKEVLRAENVQQLMLHAENGPAWVVADLVCQQLDICLVPLPAFFTPLQLKTVCEQCRVGYLLTDNADFLAALVDPDITLPEQVMGLQLGKIKAYKGKAPAYPESTGKITFTSGSTGTAKGVCLSNEQLLTQAKVLKDVVGLKSPRHLCLLPLSTLLENVAGVYAPLLADGEVILPGLQELGYQGSRLIDPQKMLGLIQEIAPDTVILIPELLKLLVAAAKSGWTVPKSFKFIAVGGSKVGTTLLRQARELGLPVYEGYGLSECASVVSLNTPSSHLAGSCGKPLPHVGLKIVNGEILVSGNAMLGYLHDPGSWHQEIINTGDLGHLNAEGFVVLDGRKKNILISSYGRNISPEWPESELLASGLLQDVVVFGDARPYCVALVSSRDPLMSNAGIQQWLDEINNSLPDYAQIKAWYRLPQALKNLPGLLTRNGRPRRDEIARRFGTDIEVLYRNEQNEPSQPGEQQGKLITPAIKELM